MKLINLKLLKSKFYQFPKIKIANNGFLDSISKANLSFRN
ncbi:hypothetical protein EW14_1475 [Prochlorococcus sp. MIT 0604]|nr:hypothetical protein EW14_1475 [Prochlorococcus sp. MIT 0604]